MCWVPGVSSPGSTPGLGGWPQTVCRIPQHSAGRPGQVPHGQGGEDGCGHQEVVQTLDCWQSVRVQHGGVRGWETCWHHPLRLLLQSCRAEFRHLQQLQNTAGTNWVPLKLTFSSIQWSMLPVNFYVNYVNQSCILCYFNPSRAAYLVQIVLCSILIRFPSLHLSCNACNIWCTMRTSCLKIFTRILFLGNISKSWKLTCVY